MTPEEVRQWIESEETWPTADSYDLSDLEPRPVLRRREEMLRPLVPDWFWRGEKGVSILSVGLGKGYFERKYWGDFDEVFIVEPSEKSRVALEHFPGENLQLLGQSLFDVSWRHRRDSVPKYGWLGACAHYLFREFYGWEFMAKLAMLVSDTLVLDATVIDGDGPQGRFLADLWRNEEHHGHEPFELHRRSEMSYEAFRRSIDPFWSVETETATPWIEDGRRNLVLKRRLPPSIQLDTLEIGEPVVKAHGFESASYRTALGYFKASRSMASVLVYDVVSKVMGWDDLVTAVVYDGEEYAGFLMKDCGDVMPSLDAPHVSERLHLGVINWTLPLGLVPADVARENIRVVDGRDLWIDIDLVGVRELNSRDALWVATNMYKQYAVVPPYVTGSVYRANVQRTVARLPR